MATIAQDNLVYALGFDVKKVQYPIDTAGTYTFNQGDMVYLDTSAKLLKAVAAASSVNFVGVALKSSQLSLFVNQNTGSATVTIDPMGLVGVNGVFSFKTTAAETYSEGTALYIGADAQTVTTVSTTNTQIGIAKMPYNKGNAGTITGAAGTSIDVLIMVAYPAAGF